MLTRFVIYGLLGLCLEVAWTALGAMVRRRDWTLPGATYLWMFPIYGLLAPLYQGLYGLVCDEPWPVRAFLWALGFTTVELCSGWILERITGRCPWDYVRAKARFAINPYIRWDYLPLWAALGLALEPVQAFLVRLTPAIEAALRAS